MKKIVLLISCLALVTLSYSQALTFGPLVGFNTSKLTTNIPDYSEEAKANFLVGAFLRVGKKLYVQPEVVYTVKGGLLNRDNQDGQTSIKLKQLEVPLMVGFKLINLEVLNLRIMGGPVMGFITDKEISLDDPTSPFQNDWLKDTQWAFQIGAGLDILFLTLDVRYEFGLNNMYNPPSGNEQYDLKNNMFRISLGWLIL